LGLDSFKHEALGNARAGLTRFVIRNLPHEGTISCLYPKPKKKPARRPDPAGHALPRARLLIPCRGRAAVSTDALNWSIFCRGGHRFGAENAAKLENLRRTARARIPDLLTSGFSPMRRDLSPVAPVPI